MKVLALFLGLLLVGVPVLAQGVSSRRPESEVTTDLQIDRCTPVVAGTKIRLRFAMNFDRPLPQYAYYFGGPVFERPAAVEDHVQNMFPGQKPEIVLRVSQISIIHAQGSDEYEYVGIVAKVNRNGEYPMINFDATAQYNDPLATGFLTANALLTDEAKKQIGRYRVCVVGGLPEPMPPKGKITFVGSPNK